MKETSSPGLPDTDDKQGTMHLLYSGRAAHLRAVELVDGTVGLVNGFELDHLKGACWGDIRGQEFSPGHLHATERHPSNGHGPLLAADQSFVQRE